MIMAEVSIYPIGSGSHLSKPVSAAVDIIDKSGLNYKLTPMGTIIEGNWDEVFGVIQKCFAALQAEYDRISINIKVDCCKGDEPKMQQKVQSVEQKLHKKLKV
jgi:uncharacterized protein (TIGR00106 family)